MATRTFPDLFLMSSTCSQHFLFLFVSGYLINCGWSLYFKVVVVVIEEPEEEEQKKKEENKMFW